MTEKKKLIRFNKNEIWDSVGPKDVEDVLGFSTQCCHNAREIFDCTICLESLLGVAIAKIKEMETKSDLQAHTP